MACTYACTVNGAKAMFYATRSDRHHVVEEDGIFVPVLFFFVCSCVFFCEPLFLPDANLQVFNIPRGNHTHIGDDHSPTESGAPS